MCICKRKIYNSRYNPHDPLSRQYIEVNCNHCWQCRLERSNGYSFRVLQEVLRGNIVPFFVTLTYAPAYLPYILYRISDCGFDDAVKISCWNRTHVQRFNKRLRRALEYYYGLASDSFRFLCCCERGSDRLYIADSGRVRQAQELPHYHLMYLLNVPDNPVPVRTLPDDYYSYIRKCEVSDSFVSFFHFLLHDKWFYGNVDDVQYCRDVVSATSYITKYLTKDINEYVFNLNLPDVLSLHDKDCNGRYKKRSSRSKPVRFCSLCPRPFCSVNLGMSFLDGKSESEVFDYLSGSKKVTLPFKRSCSLITLPFYYFNRLCRNTYRLHTDRYYSRSYVINGVVHYGVQYTSSKVRSLTPRWDSCSGFNAEFRFKTYSYSSVNELGRKVQRYRILSSVKSASKSILNYFRSKDYFLSLWHEYNSLPEADKINVKPVTQNQIDDFDTLPLNDFFQRFLALRYNDEKFLTNDETILSNFLNFNRLCRYVESRNKHLAFEKSYAQALPSVAFNNPELFLNHYI